MSIKCSEKLEKSIFQFFNFYPHPPNLYLNESSDVPLLNAATFRNVCFLLFLFLLFFPAAAEFSGTQPVVVVWDFIGWRATCLKQVVHDVHIQYFY